MSFLVLSFLGDTRDTHSSHIVSLDQYDHRIEYRVFTPVEANNETFKGIVPVTLLNKGHYI